ncbi:hypothetical protein DFJ58DRAFT_665273 [Suillus subalutaceus]|uniref:uncharacterized protein n=1 Tax=Suillus subalutaceus TaxID=48586 RepID=UPI001B8676CF|nr:uncharacterized protein DFJ58DRAFT_665273 [Suillus subalutaceus]KAG1843450.1 hypothetical protein DFJ58DRAFT_665273 [Suillus subalutaceus]
MDRRQCETLARNDVRRGVIVREARILIYEKDLAVSSAAVECILKEQSWVPTLVNCLGPLGFNIFCALVVDLLHEFEIGVWKSLFIHLLQIITVQDKSLIHILGQRYGVLSLTLVTLTILCIDTGQPQSNSSDMKRMAARDFEDLLQV